MRLAACALLLSTTAAIAQPATVEQRVANEIGSCILQRTVVSAENEALKARVAALEAAAKEPAKKPE